MSTTSSWHHAELGRLRATGMATIACSCGSTRLPGVGCAFMLLLLLLLLLLLQNFGIAVGGLAAPAGLYMPSRLLINAWSDGSNPQVCAAQRFNH